MKVLIVDDEKDIQRLYEQRFRKERRSNQIELHFAFSVQDAIHFLEQKDADDLQMILSDINMPGMSGLELLNIVRENHPNLKIYMITAYDDVHNRQKAMILGATDYLTKPIDFKVLKELIFA